MNQDKTYFLVLIDHFYKAEERYLTKELIYATIEKISNGDFRTINRVLKSPLLIKMTNRTASILLNTIILVALMGVVISNIYPIPVLKYISLHIFMGVATATSIFNLMILPKKEK